MYNLIYNLIYKYLNIIIQPSLLATELAVNALCYCILFSHRHFLHDFIYYYASVINSCRAGKSIFEINSLDSI